MSSTLPKMLVLDTNIWLDYCLAQRRGHRTALDLVGRCFELGVQMLFPTTSAKDVFYISAREMKKAAAAQKGAVDAATSAAITRTAWALIDNITAVSSPLAIDTADLWLAQRYEDTHGDLEDDLIVAATLRCKADFLVTNDKQLILDAPVAALTPQRLLELLG